MVGQEGGSGRGHEEGQGERHAVGHVVVPLGAATPEYGEEQDRQTNQEKNRNRANQRAGLRGIHSVRPLGSRFRGGKASGSVVV